MAHDLSRTSLDDFGSLVINDLLPERPLIVGEFSSAYADFRSEMLKDLAPATKYEFIQALQLLDLNWAIMQLKASANVELSSGTERSIRLELKRILQAQAKGKFDYLLEIFVENGGNADDFDAPIDFEQIETRVDSIVCALKSENYSTRVAASNEALDIGISPQLVFSDQLLNNQNYLAHTEKLPDLEKRIRQLSAEYRELQISRPEEVFKWFNLILNNPEGAFEEPNSGDQRQDLALRLAVAEACYHRALYLVEAPAHKVSPGRQVHNELLAYLYDLLMEVENLPDGKVADLNDTGELKLGVAVLKFFDKAAHREQRLYRRYLGEARAQRKKAFRDWCAFNRDENQNSRNELKLQFKGE